MGKQRAASRGKSDSAAKPRWRCPAHSPPPRVRFGAATLTASSRMLCQPAPPLARRRRLAQPVPAPSQCSRPSAPVGRPRTAKMGRWQAGPKHCPARQARPGPKHGRQARTGGGGIQPNLMRKRPTRMVSLPAIKIRIMEPASWRGSKYLVFISRTASRESQDTMVDGSSSFNKMPVESSERTTPMATFCQTADPAEVTALIERN